MQLLFRNIRIPYDILQVMFGAINRMTDLGLRAEFVNSVTRRVLKTTMIS